MSAGTPTPQRPAAPVRYSEGVEQPQADEAETIRELVDTLRSIADTTKRDHGRGLRSVHAKCHGIVFGELLVDDDLPPELAQGLFSRRASYPVVVRFSTSPGDPIHDNVSLPRAMAIKIIGVEGERVSGDETSRTQDFVMVNGPVFLKRDAKSFLKSLKLLARTTDRAEGAKKVLSSVLRGAEKALEAIGGESATLKAIGGQPRTHLLGETFFTQVPLRFGEYMAKLSLAPASESLRRLTDLELEPGDDNPHYLRDASVEFFAHDDAEWKLRAQLCVGLDEMPVEDASVEWPEEKSAYRTIARLVVPRQPAWIEGPSGSLDERLSFTPWHALAAHRPLGSVMRARRDVYRAMAAYRAQQNGVAFAEPRSVEELQLRDLPPAR
ncbi:MAG: catalase family protein [Rhodanobacteraceae bacterium]